MKAAIQLLRGILCILWLLLLGVNLLLFLDETSSGHHPPQLAGWMGWHVADARMEPALSQDDLALISLDVQAQPGDMVLFVQENRRDLSRIIGTSEGQLILKPDGSEESLLLAPENIQGVCVTFLPGFGPAAQAMHSLPGLIGIFLAGLILIVLPGLLLRPARAPQNRRGRYSARH